MNGIPVMEWNPEAEVLTVVFHGRISLPEMQAHLAEVISVTDRITGEFTLLTDLSKLDAMDKSCVPALGKIMDCFRKHGVRQIIRVTPHPEKDIGFNILSLFHYDRSVPIVTCATRAEANAILTAK
jgi:hypothetical protein